jgi:xanthine dehydrogenase iron-sulfur cluster and FAD-binding subunit A
MLTLTVNGTPFETTADPRRPFLEVLREELGLRGAKYGCGEGECGACTVIVDGETVCSCLAMTGSLAGCEITSVEGLANDPVGVRLTNAFAEQGAVQCGFCTPGFVLSAWQLLAHGGGAEPAEIRDAVGGNLCRCTGYVRILDAISASADGAMGSPLAARVGQGRDTVRVPARYWRPATLEELLDGLADFSESPRIIAGGTDLMVQHEHRLDALALVDVSAIPRLAGIEETATHIRIGAATTWSEIRRSELLARWAPLLPLAAAEIGGIQIQNRATIGGNVANASPAADGLPALYVHEAGIVTALGHETRVTPIADFVTGPGRTLLRPGEIITDIRIPKHQGDGEAVFFFEKVGPRKAQTITKASVAFHGRRKDGRILDPRIALGAAAPTVIRAQEAEHLLAADSSEEAIQRAAELVSAATRPIDDIRSTAEYRRRLVGGLLLRGLLKLKAQPESDDE